VKNDSEANKSEVFYVEGATLKGFFRVTEGLAAPRFSPSKG